MIAVSVEDKAKHPGISDLIADTNLVGSYIANALVTDYLHPHFWTLGRTAPQLTVAEDRIRCAKDWFEACDKGGHRGCKPTEGFLPTRLIDLRANHAVRLVHVNRLDKQEERLRYATLSHCWGSPEVAGPLKTTKERAEAFGKGISEGMLPKTFRDAIRVTRSLGIPFLWIDSLCIIQDDPDKWQREASRMKHVYSGSVLTISASCGRDSSSGFLPEDDVEIEGINPIPGLEQDVTVKASPLITNNEHLGHFSFDYRNHRVGRQQGVMVRLQTDPTTRQLEEAHLSTRGWACQEEILSRRILHCLDSEIVWKCERLCHTQSGRTTEELRAISRAGMIKPTLVEDWCYWIQDYTTRDFTISSDRMPAFSGIAELFQDLLHQKILLGVRRESLSKDLSWIRLGPEKGPADTGAPSWSWLSCNAPVYLDYWKLPNDEINPQACTVPINCSVDWTGPAMTSPIQKTLFRIRGPVMQMALRIAPESLTCNPPYFLVGEEASDFSQGPLPWRYVGQFDHESHPGCVKAEYTCLLLFSRTNEDGITYREVFLLLSPDTETWEDGQLETAKPCRFNRVGIAMIRGSEKTFSRAQERTLDLS
ncbi:het domain protein [Colletotrichum kahawae]|uniref:Het domain protein n=1 Tax=Colletotrichum kahawae TaxID=34407 RepID=A0AAD9YKN7_COLKA|nr:het domain protein [Colletotrichum kahawae]